MKISPVKEPAERKQNYFHYESSGAWRKGETSLGSLELCSLYCSDMKYGDSVDNTVENSSIFSLIWMY